MSAPEPSAVVEVVRQLATALMELAVAVNRQTQATEALAAETRQLVEGLAAASAAAPTDGPHPDDRDHIPTHDLGGQPIHVR